MRRRPARTVAAALLLAYAIALAVVALWPRHLDGPHGERVRPLVDQLVALGVGPDPAAVYATLESGANVALYVPFGVLVTALLPGLVRLAAPLVGVGMSAASELAQRELLPGRTGDPRDLVANTVGFVLGTAIVLVGTALGSRAARRCDRRRTRVADREGVGAQAAMTPVPSSTISTTPSSTR